MLPVGYERAYRLIEQQASGGVATIQYAGDGLRRTAFEAGGTLTTMVWDGDDYLGEV
jgi:hypothetical protein